MKLDKKLYHQVHEWYREWNQDELLESARNAGKRPIQEGWEQYLSLYRFYRQMNLEPSYREREQKIAALDQYCFRVDRMEKWRRARGKRN